MRKAPRAPEAEQPPPHAQASGEQPLGTPPGVLTTSQGRGGHLPTLGGDEPPGPLLALLWWDWGLEALL